MTEKPKYRAVPQKHEIELDTWFEKINALAEAGYRVHTIDLELGVALMSLSSAKYENITNLKDVPPHEADSYLAKGWRITESYSKFVRMVKPNAKV